MAKLMVMYKTPKDVKAFDKHYLEIHAPLAKKIPGLRKLEVTQGPIVTPAGPSGYHAIATLYFDDLAALKKALASPEGQAAAADAQAIATGGVDMLMSETREV